ncbi:MAG: sensor histidine kinase [Bacteroidales bacterium]|nr:sensor histidine kinase [Bacteroidales bacterium]
MKTICKWIKALCFIALAFAATGCNFTKNSETVDNQTPDISDSLTRAISYNALGQDYLKKDSLQQAVALYDSALLLLSDNNSATAQSERAKILLNKGLVFQLYDDYETAYELYLEAEVLLSNAQDYNRLINLYGKMGNIFLRNSNFERNKQIVEKGKEIIDKVTDLDAMVDYYIHQSSICFYDDDYQSSADFHKKALEILNQTQNLHQLHTVYYNMGLFAREQEQFEESEIYCKKALSFAEASGNKSDICDALLNLGLLFYYQEKFTEAESYMKKGLQIAQELRSKLLLRNAYSDLSYVEYSRNNMQKAFSYRDSSDYYEVELVSAETQNKLNFMAVKYDLAQKEANIRDLENKMTIQQYRVKLRDTLLIAISSLIVVMGALVMVYVRYTKRKRLLSETRIKQLEQEKQLIAAQAVLDGENAERSRLAKDLHDGLGGMLSLVKINLPAVKSGGIIEVGDVARFQKAITLLDDSIGELRRVAHHIMPESLMRHGLKASLADFCHAPPSVEFHYFGDDQRLDNKVEILIYRAAHELINNALKHAEATQINVQLIQETDRVSLTIHDNGKGFDPETTSDGMGLENIRNRVKTCNGKMTLYSAPGQGTEVNVEV